MIRGGQVGWRRRGLVYWEGGPHAPTAEPVAFLPDEYVHFAPIPDPLATYRGMSWLTPILREIENDKSMTGISSHGTRRTHRDIAVDATLLFVNIYQAS